MANDRDRELLRGLNGIGIAIQGESSAGRRRQAAGILGGRMGTVDDEGEEGEQNPWTGWAVGTVVPDEANPVQHDAAGQAEPVLQADVDQRYAAASRVVEVADSDCADEDMLRIVVGPRRMARGSFHAIGRELGEEGPYRIARGSSLAIPVTARGIETDVDVSDDIDGDATVETSIDHEIGGDTQVDVERVHEDVGTHGELDELADALVAKVEGESAAVDRCPTGGCCDRPDVRSRRARSARRRGHGDWRGDRAGGIRCGRRRRRRRRARRRGRFRRRGAHDVPPRSAARSRPRHRRRDRPRSKTIALKRLTRAELRRARSRIRRSMMSIGRARARSAATMPRPCPWVACKHHLYLDINPRHRLDQDQLPRPRAVGAASTRARSTSRTAAR